MKRFIKISLITAVLVAVLAVAASAAMFDYTHCADSLNEMGLFRGTQNGYELDRAPNRAEAATMLVRLLGAEEEALACSYTAPFSDVADWAKPYVQYLYDNGLTKGTSATTFGYSDTCTAQQYVTFVLRALGYSDGEGGDFAYINALDFGRKTGIVNLYTCDEADFVRGDVVAISFTALSTAPKSGEADLLTKLVASGAIKDDKGYIGMFKNYRAFEAIGASSEDARAISTKLSATGEAFVNGTVMAKFGLSGAIAADVTSKNINELKLAIDSKLNIEVLDEFIETLVPELEEMSEAQKKEYLKTVKEELNKETADGIYIKDGYVYDNYNGEKVKSPISTDNFAELAPESAEAENAPNVICLFSKISVEKDLSRATETYSIEFGKGLFERLFGEKTDGVEISMPMSAEYVIKNGKINGVLINMDLTVSDGEQEIGIAVTFEMTDIKYGKAVTVKFPSDLNAYIEE